MISMKENILQAWRRHVPSRHAIDGNALLLMELQVESDSTMLPFIRVRRFYLPFIHSIICWLSLLLLFLFQQKKKEKNPCPFMSSWSNASCTPCLQRLAPLKYTHKTVWTAFQHPESISSNGLPVHSLSELSFLLVINLLEQPFNAFLSIFSTLASLTYPFTLEIELRRMNSLMLWFCKREYISQRISWTVLWKQNRLIWFLQKRKPDSKSALCFTVKMVFSCLQLQIKDGNKSSHGIWLEVPSWSWPLVWAFNTKYREKLG